MDSLRARLEEDMKVALKARDAVRLSTIRMARAEIRNADIAARGELDDGGIAEVLAREVKKRRETIEQCQRANRRELMEKESAELEILLSYLPAQLTEDELRELARRTIVAVGASSARDISQVMKTLMPQVKGRADGRQVSRIVSELLA